MAADRTEDESVARNAAQFATTHWSVVLAAGDSASPDSREALEKLCRTYWYPLYAFVRRKGYSPENAEDLTQGFFERFLEKHYVRDVRQAKGRFRTFLLTTLHRFLCDQFDRSAAVKRGGGAVIVPLSVTESESRFSEAVTPCANSSEVMFDQDWAETIVQLGVERLRAEQEADGRGQAFQELKAYLSRPGDRASYATTGELLGLSSEAVAMAVVRLRRRFRSIVRDEVANTVASPAEIDEEMRYLVELLTR